MIEKIVSGACIGADIAGLRAAKKLGIQTGGYDWDHKAANTEGSEYGVVSVKECKTIKTGHRTLANAVMSDCTIHFKHANEKVTIPYLDDFYKPYFEVEMEDYKKPVWMDKQYITDFRAWIMLMRVVAGHDLTINIAGNADITMEPLVEEFLCFALSPFTMKGEAQ